MTCLGWIPNLLARSRPTTVSPRGTARRRRGAWVVLVLICLLTVALSSADLACAAGSVATVQGRTTLIRGGSAQPFSPGPPPTFLTNGDFATDLSAWTTELAGGSAAPGSVTHVAGAAQILEGDSAQVTLSQRVLIPAFPLELTFDVAQLPGFDTTTLSLIPDAFEFSLLDDNDLPIIAPWGLGATSSFNIQEDGVVLSAVGVFFSGTTVTVDLTAVPALTVATLYFDYISVDGDTAGGVQVDNVEITDDPPAGAFVRGDVDGDKSLTVTDEALLFDYLFNGGNGAVDCTGLLDDSALDVNDNEAVTVADFLMLRAANSAGLAVPAPNWCDVDPSDETHGFDAIDSGYRIAAGTLTFDPPSGVVDRDVYLPIVVDTPTDVTAVTVTLEYDDTLLDLFDPAAGDGPPVIASAGLVETVVDGSRVVLTVYTAAHGDTLLSADPGVGQEVAQVRFHIQDSVAFPAAQWVPEYTVGVLYRATVVDDLYGDHHPELTASVGDFIRGDSNDDASLNIADPIFTLSYLFQGGVDPNCLEAADSNDDGSVNIADPIHTLAFLFSGGAPLPAPHLTCGPDPGPINSLTCLDSTCQ